MIGRFQVAPDFLYPAVGRHMSLHLVQSDRPLRAQVRETYCRPAQKQELHGTHARAQSSISHCFQGSPVSDFAKIRLSFGSRGHQHELVLHWLRVSIQIHNIPRGHTLTLHCLCKPEGVAYIQPPFQRHGNAYGKPMYLRARNKPPRLRATIPKHTEVLSLAIY